MQRVPENIIYQVTKQMDTAPVDTTSILKTNLFGAWCGVAYCVLLLVGWWVIGGFFPLHRPSAGAEEIAAFFRGDVMKIRLGMVVVMWGSAHSSRSPQPWRTMLRGSKGALDL